MGAYQLLFSVTVEHEYFADYACKSLEFIPTQATAALISNMGALLRVSGNKLSIYFEIDKLNILRMYAEDSLIFLFKVFSKDPYFPLYTTPVIQQGDSILYFHNQKAFKDAAGRDMLHNNQLVSDDAFISLETCLKDNILEPRDYYVKPCFIVEIQTSKDVQFLYQDKQDTFFRKFFISFAAAHSYWKYYLLGDLSQRRLYIADLDDRIQFVETGKSILPGEHKAMILQSTTPIQMQEVSIQRLQLRESGDMGDKVLVKRLPNASLGYMNSETVSGKRNNISEIYIN